VASLNTPSVSRGRLTLLLFTRINDGGCPKPNSIASVLMAASGMSKDKKEPSKMPSSVPAELEKRGCATSFLTSERNEIDKVCGGIQATNPEEYVQPDEEKESGGEA
jgi:hypothetical protein